MIRKSSKLKYTARFYLQSANPGPGNNSSNIALHGKLMRLLNGKETFSDEELDKMLEM
jgi:hypothetical protein